MTLRSFFMCLLVGLVAIGGTAPLAEDSVPPPDEELRELVTGVFELNSNGRYAEAETEARRILAEVEAHYGENSAQVAVVIKQLVSAMWGQRKVLDGEAKALAQRGLAIAESVYGPEDDHVAAHLNAYASVLFFAGEYSAARKVSERALAMVERLFGPDDAALTLPLTSLANTLWRLGEFDAALAAQRRALRVLGPDHPQAGVILIGVCGVCGESGDFACARDACEKAVVSLERTFGPIHPYVVQARLNTVAVHLALADYVLAERVILETVSIIERNSPGDSTHLATLLTNYGILLTLTGRFEEAGQQLRRALAMTERTYGPESFEVPVVLSELASLAMHQGNFDEARQLYERALSVLDVAAPGHVNRGVVLASLGDIELNASDFTAARALFEQAQEIVEPAFGPDSPTAVEIATGLALTDWGIGDPLSALGTALDAESHSIDQFRNTARSLPEREALRYQTERRSGRDIALSSLVKLDGSSRAQNLDAVWNEVIRSRALVLDEMAERTRVAWESTDATTSRIATKLGKTRNRLAAMVVRGSSPEQIEEIRAEKERLERELARHSRVFARGLARDNVELDDVKSMLPENSALVSYVRYDQLSRVAEAPDAPADGSLKYRLEERAAYLALVRRAGEPRGHLIPLADAATIEARMAEWKTAVSNDPREVPGGDALERYRTAATALRAAVWDPVSASVGDAGLVFVVPDGALHELSFATLVDADGGYLLETGPTIHYLATERDLLGSDDTKAEGVLLVGGPDFNGFPATAENTQKQTILATSGSADEVPAVPVFRSVRSECADIQTLRFTELPGAAAEADELERLLTARAGAERLAVAPIVKLTGVSASEAWFKLLAPKHRILHLATHGFSVGASCGADSTESSRAPENPLLLTGLAFAGANRRNELPDAGDLEDGILTAEEVAALDLSGVDWAVLSACETATGVVFDGEGVMGLRRAFEIAGARSVIMTLWAVEDDATRVWARHLYFARLEQQSTAQAMRSAGLEWLALRRSRGRTTHPFYWGAFIASGDWK